MYPVNLNIEQAISNIGFVDKLLDTYTRTLAYRVQIKQLDIELEKINSQAKLAHSQIEKQYQIKMQELETNREEFLAVLLTINHELHNKHLEKMKLFQIANKCIDEAMKANTSEERKYLMEMAKEAKNDALNLSEGNVLSLDLLIQKLPAPNQYLLGGK